MRSVLPFEFIFMTGVMLPTIWLSGFIHSAITAIGITLLAIFIIRSWRKNGDTASELGLCVYPNDLKKSWIAFAAIGTILVVIVIVGHLITPGFWENKELMKKMSKISVGYAASAFLQELFLHGYFTHRLNQLRQNKHFSNAILIGIIFGLIHLPNPVLAVGTTFFAFATAYYFLAISRNIYILAFAHVILAQAISYLIARPLIGSGAMRVGPGFWQ